ncbi:MAG: acetyl-CoA carboxylase biotin carboxyl carrier protein subunit [Candidatus Pelagibacter sp.]|jgi:acetyl-CoA carboxylase biotin carboxyl carrier protein|nr:acetyl-CoA carboxylase biotin carboxyl carrier protein subunit [Candidatus Pelagibacter sp.]MBT91991.1 acetyl-CoA carboxylase biotin carboxyl carrier protein subunit [Candidatus Pelagibacter sp.]|tara:strand:- start:366 stop:722 length:357 start_codon:yes stop_codon:yes gene_type:complete
MEIDKKIIRKLIEVLEDLKKSFKDKEIVDVDDVVEEEIDISKIVIKSPIVGTAYLASEPGAKKFVEVGKKIKKGDSVIIIEAMKTMNHVPSTSDGVVKEVCVKDGQPVEFGQKLIVLE